MSLAEFSVKNSLAVNLLSVLILLAGILLIFQIPREAFPNVEFGRVLITTPYPGSTPNEVEKLIAIPLEEQLRDVDGIDDLTSISLEGLSMIAIKIDMGAKNQDKVITDIQRAVDRTTDLPDDAEDPIVDEINTHDEPILIVSLNSPDLWQLRDLGWELEDLLEEIPGVARVDKLGWRDTEIWVEVEPEKLLAYHISFEEIARALRLRNANVPGGKLYVDGEQHVVRTLGEFETPEEVEQVIIRGNDQGNWLRIADIGRARYALEDADRLDRTNGQDAVNLLIVKDQKADTLKLVERLKEHLTRFEGKLPSVVKMTVIEDLALKYVRRRLSILVNNGLIGILFLTLVLLVFLGMRVALLTSFGIPISFCITVLFMRWQGITINLIAMFGLIMVLGMLVDDAIVIAENCYRYIEKGMPPAEAAIRGTNEVIRPVTATILTTVIFFGSLLFMTGIMGRFIWVIPAVVISSLLASLFESVVILPSHIADFAVPRRGKAKAAGRIEQVKWFQRFRGFYMRLLKVALRRRWRVFGVVAVVSLAVIAAARIFMPISLFPARGVEVFYVRTESPTGTSLEQAAEQLVPIEKAIAALPEREMDHFITTIGMQQDSPGDPQQRRGTNLGQIQVYLTSAAKRKREATVIMDELREKVGSSEKMEITFEAIRTGPPVGKPIEAHLRGESFETLEKIAEEMKVFLGGIEGIKDVRDNYEPGKPEFRILVDDEAARRAQVHIADVGRALRYAYEGITATTIKRTDEEIDVRVRFPKESQSELTSLEGLVVENARGDLVPLSRIARFEQQPGLSYITHLDFKRSITISGNVNEKVITSMAANAKLAERFKDLPQRYPGYSIRFGGEQEETMESFQNFFRAFALSVLASFAVLAIGFNSLLHPFIVLVAIPFGLIGVVSAFFIHQLPLSFMTMMGTIGLSGVVLNDSIVLLTFILDQVKEGVAPIRAVIAAGRLRFRPVILTTVSTAVGLAPVAYGIGGLDVFLQPAALAITWGIVFATPLTLIMVPCLYVMEHDVRAWWARHSPHLTDRMRSHAAKGSVSI